jgi:hypothetical protein
MAGIPTYGSNIAPDTGRYSIDYLDLFLGILRNALPDDVTVLSRLPDHLPDFVPLVVIRRTAGRTQFPRYTDRPWISTQVWAGGDDPFREASDLIDKVRGALFKAWDEQIVVPGVGCIVDIRESSGPVEISDPDVPRLGRYEMLHEIRIRQDLT